MQDDIFCNNSESSDEDASTLEQSEEKSQEHSD
jgi:hypothetical protein